MSLKIAEYFGQKTEINEPVIQPIIDRERCPFTNGDCVKLIQKNKPVCTVRRNNGDLWMVCKNRLCATKGVVPLTQYQRDVLFTVAKTVFGQDVIENDIVIKREVTIPVVENSNYHADFVMMNIGERGRRTGQHRVILEMQGGGETSNTGTITRHIQTWEEKRDRSNDFLSMNLGASPIVTNAWRRQQEQFIIKGNIAQQTGGGIVFCVGQPLYDYLWERVLDANLNDLRNHNWTLALICFSEDKNDNPGPIKFKIDNEKIIFTNYLTFVQTLINQGMPNPEMFEGNFERLNGARITI